MAWVLCVLLVVVLCAGGARAQESAAQKMRLGKIEVSGLQHTPLEEVIAASGLQTGQQVSVAALDEAAGRLLQTGLFSKLSYRYRTTGGEAVVTFLVEEARGSVPVVFDNFIWFTHEELVSAVRRELPAFDGSAPESQGAIAAITRALAGLLAARHITGQVEEMAATDESGAHPRRVFSVRGVRVPLCQLHFPGATNIAESELIKNSRPLFENDYSQETVAAFAVGNLLPLYHQRGHLRAVFAAPTASAVAATGANTSANCNGADVTIPVTEGAAYLWDKAAWAGAAALGAAELDAALNMKAGEVADGLKIEKGWHAVSRAYGRRGYLMARVKPAPAFDDEHQRVSYDVQLDEGAQFHMGTLAVVGLAEADAARLQRAWQLAPGAIFNMDYLEEFNKKLPLLRLEGFGTRFKGYKTDLKPNRQTLTVDVTLSFK
jgi:outer membrane protein assembly factor BamA